MNRALKGWLQTLLKRAGVYHRLKSSRLYDWYWSTADANVLSERDREVSFYRKVLRDMTPGDLVFDIGANIGHKCDVFLRLGSRVVAVDPDASNQAALRQRFHSWRLRRKPVSVVNAAVSSSSGTETMWVDEPGSAKNTLNRKWVDTLRVDSSRFGSSLTFGEQRQVPTTTLDDLIRAHGLPFYIKIDVEGHEPEVLEGLSTPVRFVSFEVNLPEFLPEALRCVDLLESLAPRGAFNHSSSCASGLELSNWQGKEAFLHLLRATTAPSIEVFWRGPGFDSAIGEGMST